MPAVEVSSPSMVPGAIGKATWMAAEGHEATNPAPTSPPALLAEDRREEDIGINHAVDRTSGGVAGASESGWGVVSKGEGLVMLEEAIDDGTVVKTAGTLIFTTLEVSEDRCWWPLNFQSLLSRLFRAVETLTLVAGTSNAEILCARVISTYILLHGCLFFYSPVKGLYLDPNFGHISLGPRSKFRHF